MKNNPCKYMCENADLFCMFYCNHPDHKTNKPDKVCYEVYKNRINKKGSLENENY